jgi:hypothetical protein
MSRIGSTTLRRRSCLCHSPTLRPWIADLGRGVLRGGVLQPGARRCHRVSAR